MHGTFVVEDACDAGGHVVVRFLLAQVFHVMKKVHPYQFTFVQKRSRYNGLLPSIGTFIILGSQSLSIGELFHQGLASGLDSATLVSCQVAWRPFSHWRQQAR